MPTSEIPAPLSTRSLSCSFNKDLLGTYYVPGAVLGSGDPAVNKTKMPVLVE